MRLGVGFPGTLPGPQLLRLAREAEQRGFDSIWIGEHYFSRDAVSLLGAVAAKTTRLRLASCVLNPYTRHPALLAMTFATLDELAQGRLVVGLGPSVAQWIEPMGIPFKAPVRKMRHCIHALRRLWAGERAVEDRSGSASASIRLQWIPSQLHIPILVAAMAPGMLRLAGEVADGVILTSCVPPGYMKWAVEEVHEGARIAGRALEQFEVVSCVQCAVDSDPRRARDVLRPLVARFTSLNALASRALYREYSSRPTAWARMLSAYEQQGLEAAIGELNDEMLDEVAVAGSPEEVAVRLQRLARLGVTTVVLYLASTEELPAAGALRGSVSHAGGGASASRAPLAAR